MSKSELTIEEYAPVLIPTLCRYETLKKCLDSLSVCTGASSTDVHVALDYPSNEKHWAGYYKISSYLEGLTGFKNVFVYKRENNYGIIKNAQDLIQRVSNQYSCFIFTEDDNEFSPNFLEYINKGLKKYRDNPDVIAICGFNYPFPYLNNIKGYYCNAYPVKAYTAWGVARWTNKIPYDFVNEKKATEIVYSWEMVKKLWKLGMHATVHRLLYRHKEGYSDLMYHIYFLLNNKYAIFPAISKVRNWGFEGNASHCYENPIYAKQKIDDATSFDYDDFEIKDYSAITKIHQKMYGRGFWVRRLCELEYLLFRMTGHVLRDFRLIAFFQGRNKAKSHT